MNKSLVRTWLARIAAVMVGLGPYAAIELLLPGGSIIAALVWVLRHRTGHGLRR